MTTKLDSFMIRTKSKEIASKYDINDTIVFNAINEINLESDHLNDFFNAIELGYKYYDLFKYKKIEFDFNLENNINERAEQYIKSSNSLLNKYQNLNKVQDRSILKHFKENRIIKMDRIYTCYEKTLQYKQLFNNENNFTTVFSKYLTDQSITPSQKNRDFNNFEINLNLLIKKSQVKKLVRSIVSNKNKHLIDEKTEELFLSIIDNKKSIKKIRDLISKKVSAIKDADSFNLYISDILNIDVPWQREDLIKKIERMNGEVLMEKDNKIFFDVNNFNQTSSLGSQQWCLCRDQKHINDYAYENNDRLVFVYDLEKSPNNIFSKTACLYQQNKLIEVYDKEDNPYKAEDLSNNEDNLFDLENIFEDYNSYKIPIRSDKTIKTRRDFYNNGLFEIDKDDSLAFEGINNIMLLDLISMNSFDIVDKYIQINKHIDPINLYRDNDKMSYSALKSLDLNNFDKLLNQKNFNKILPSSFDKDYFLLDVTSEQLDSDSSLSLLSQNKTLIKSLKNIHNNIKSNDKFDTLNLFKIENNKFERTIDLLINNNITTFDLIQSVYDFSNITDSNFKTLINKDPLLSNKMFQNNERKFVVFLLKTTIEKDTISSFLKPLKSDYSELINKAIQAIERNNKEEDYSAKLEHYNFLLQVNNNNNNKNKTIKNKM